MAPAVDAARVVVIPDPDKAMREGRADGTGAKIPGAGILAGILAELLAEILAGILGGADPIVRKDEVRCHAVSVANHRRSPLANPR